MIINGHSHEHDNPFAGNAQQLPQTMDQIQDQFNDLTISDGSSLEELLVKSYLNPNAKVFVR
ncbi:Polyadenylate-binding protein-interacting protein 2, partial [Galemys pyrenaicus]